MRVVHATEALAGGVLSSLAVLAAAQAAEGLAVSVLHVRRADTPAVPLLESMFPSDVTVREVKRPGGKIGSLIGLSRELRALRRRDRELVVHLHSSFAGAFGRIALARPRVLSPRTFYSPHGYAFLREDLPKLARRGFRSVERALGERAVSVLVSESEAELARSVLGLSHVEVLRNGLPTIPQAIEPPAQRASIRPTVAMSGRVAFQKAPWRFAEVARRASHLADFVWIGGGREHDIRRWLGGSSVRITGWLSHDEAMVEMANADIFCFPTLWEGLPMTLIEAQAMGIPAVASNIVGNRDAIQDGVTGYLAESDDSLHDRTVELILDGELRARMGVAAARRARAEFSSVTLGPESRALYSRWAGSRIDRETQ